MTLKARVIFNCEDNEVVSRIGSVLRVKLCASEKDAILNDCMRKCIADFFGVHPKYVNIIRGAKGREKTIEITGKPEEDLKEMLEAIP